MSEISIIKRDFELNYGKKIKELKSIYFKYLSDKHYRWLIVFILISCILKLYMIFVHGNNLNLASDDLNYIKSAVALARKGIFVFHEYNEPTVFITPIYPIFLAIIFKVFGYGFIGLQIGRVIQAVLSLITIILTFLVANCLFDKKIALISSFLVSFYYPNIITPGYFLTENLFTPLLLLLIYFSLKFQMNLKPSKFIILGVLWAITTLCRPTVALYPFLLLFHMLINKKHKIKGFIRSWLVMILAFIVIMKPWWIRNYVEYKTFIPLAESSGNPLLQGTYIGYNQTPENIVYYKLGKNAFETNKIEVEVAKNRIKEGFKNNFWRYLKWYTIDKTYLFWFTIFYWKEFSGITYSNILPYHFIILTGLLVIPFLLIKKFNIYFLPISILGYFNAVHCLYMAFDRYAFPLLPILSIFAAFFILKMGTFLLKIKKRYFIER